MGVLSFLLELLQGGLANLAAYLAAHVLLCLLPAFFIAGAMTALIPKESVTRFLGCNTPRYISYPAAALACTGVAIGPDLAFARLLLSLAFGVGIGLIMALIFSRDDAAHDKIADESFAGRRSMRRAALLFLLMLVALLLSGTLKIGLLTNAN